MERTTEHSQHKRHTQYDASNHPSTNPSSLPYNTQRKVILEITMDGLLRRRGGATALIAKAYLDHKRSQIVSSIRNGFSKRRTSDDDIEAQNFLAHDGDDVHGDAPFLTILISKYRNFPCWTRGVLVAAAWGLAMNLLMLMTSFHAWVTILAGIVASAVAAAVFTAELKMENLEELYEVQNGIRRDVNRFANENAQLATSVSKLNYQASSLQQQEAALSRCAEEQSTNVKTLLNLVKENREVLDEKKQTIRRDLIASLMGLVIKGEQDDSGDFSEREIRRMIMYMRGLPAVKINEELLRKAIKTDNSALSILHLVQDIGREGLQEGDNIFIIEDRDQDLLVKLREAP